MLRRDTLALTALLALLTALGPLAMDLYLPSFPDIGRMLAASAADVQLTISGYLVGFALGQLVYGPVSDRFGRKPVLSVALLIFIAGTVGCAVAPDIDTLIAARSLQGAGASGVIVLARAVVRDLYEGPRAARELALMGAIMGVTPILAPMAGGVLQETLGWRSAFVVILLAGAAAVVVVRRLLPETVPPLAPGKSAVGEMLTSYGIIARNPSFLAHLGIVTGSFCGLFAFISGSSFVVQGIYGLSPLGFGIFYGVSSLGFLAGTFTAAHIVMRLGFDRTMGIGTTALATGGILLAVAVTVLPGSIVALSATMVVFLAGLGLSMPQALAGAMQPFPERAGAASSLTGFVQQTAGAAVGHFIGHSAWPMVIPITGSGVITFLIWATTRRVRARGTKRA